MSKQIKPKIETIEMEPTFLSDNCKKYYKIRGEANEKKSKYLNEFRIFRIAAKNVKEILDDLEVYRLMLREAATLLDQENLKNTKPLAIVADLRVEMIELMTKIKKAI